MKIGRIDHNWILNVIKLRYYFEKSFLFIWEILSMFLASDLQDYDINITKQGITREQPSQDTKRPILTNQPKSD